MRRTGSTLDLGLIMAHPLHPASLLPPRASGSRSFDNGTFEAPRPAPEPRPSKPLTKQVSLRFWCSEGLKQLSSIKLRMTTPESRLNRDIDMTPTDFAALSFRAPIQARKQISDSVDLFIHHLTKMEVKEFIQLCIRSNGYQLDLGSGLESKHGSGIAALLDKNKRLRWASCATDVIAEICIPSSSNAYTRICMNLHFFTPKGGASYLLNFQLFPKESLAPDVFCDPEGRRRRHFLRVMIRSEPRKYGRKSCRPQCPVCIDGEIVHDTICARKECLRISINTKFHRRT